MNQVCQNINNDYIYVMYRDDFYLILFTFMSNWTLISPPKKWWRVSLLLGITVSVYDPGSEAVILIPSGEQAEGKREEQKNGKAGSPMTLLSHWITQPWARTGLLKMWDNGEGRS